MRFPAGFIEELKYRNDLEQIISRYVTLKRAGSNLVGCCPFHSEKTPSFTLFQATKTYHCFGCGAGGDVISFVMNIENLEYMPAIERLCSYAGMQMPVDNTESIRDITRRKRLLEMNRETAVFYYKYLLSPDGKDALDYLLNRGISMATIKHFGIGYAPLSWDGLVNHLQGLGYKPEEMKDGFLCGINKNGRPFDYFRGRIIFPIVDLSSHVIAFGGRVTDNSTPKYLNSSDTAVFKKKYNLYAMNYAKSAAKDDGTIILCEGYMDVVALHQAGFTNAVATLGTAITSDQAREMARYAKKTVIAYDSDNAGIAASTKATNLLNSVGVEVKILNIQGAKDPDEYIKKYGADSFKHLLEGSSGYIDHRIDAAGAKYDLSIAEQKVKALREVCTILSEIASPVEREVYCVKAAKTYDVSQENIIKQCETIRRDTYKKAKKAQTEQRIRASAGYGDRVNPDAMNHLLACRAEESILGILILYPELYEKIKESLSPDDFVTEFNQNVYVQYREITDELRSGGRNFDIGYFSGVFTTQQIGKIAGMTAAREKLTVNDLQTLSELITTLKRENEKQRRGDSSHDILDMLAQIKKDKDT